MHRGILVLLLGWALMLACGEGRPAWAQGPRVPEVTADGDLLKIDGNPVFLKGVAYSPFIAGDVPWDPPPRKVNFASDLRRIRQELHANAVSVYTTLPKKFYDEAREQGVWVIQGISFPEDPASHAQDAPTYLLTPDYLSARKAAVRQMITDIHVAGAEDVVIAYVLGSRLSTPIIENTIRSNQEHPRYHGTHYSVPDTPSLPRFDLYAGCEPPPVSSFPDPHPFQSFLAEIADDAAAFELETYGHRHLVGHATTAFSSAFLEARDRPAPKQDLPVDLGFLDIIFEYLFTYDFPFITYEGLPAYLRNLKVWYPSRPVVILETGYSTSPSSTNVPAPLCGASKTTPEPLSLEFGGATEAEQAASLEARWVDITCADRPLAGFFVFSYYDEWWYTGDVATQDDHPLEHFGIVRVSKTPGGFDVTDKLAFGKLAQLYGCVGPEGDPDSCGLVLRSIREIPAQYGEEFEHAFQVEGGKPPYQISVEDPASLPPGVSLVDASRLVGTPERVGEHRFRLLIADSSPLPIRRTFVCCLEVAPPDFAVAGREILMNGRPFYMKGIDYSPFTAGDAPWTAMTKTDPFADLREIKETLHANTIRVYQALPRQVYDAARENGLFVIQGIHLQVDGPEPGDDDCADTELDLLEPAFFQEKKEHVLAEVDHVNEVGGSDVVLAYVVGNEVSFCVQRSTILKHQDMERYEGRFYSVPKGPPRLPDLDKYPTCPATTDKFWDPHPFQSFITELVDLATAREVDRFGERHLMAHATDPNMSIAVSAKDRFVTSLLFPVDMGFLDIVFQNVYGYFPPYLRFVGYGAYLNEVKKAYPDTPFVILECGYSVSQIPEQDCAAGPNCGMPQVPKPLSLCFGSNTDDQQAQGIAYHYEEALSEPALTAGFFVFEYMDEWWKGGERSQFVRDEDRAEEWFGLKSVEGLPDDFTVTPRPAFETVARMYDKSWCPGIERLVCDPTPEGVRIDISPRDDVDSVAISRNGSPLAVVRVANLPYIDPAPPAGEVLYSVVPSYAFVPCPALERRLSLQAFRRGDANADGLVNITDGIFTLNFLFLGGPTPGCLDAADSNDETAVNITDGIYTLNYLFLGGPAPPPPGPDACGGDPTADGDLECAYPPEKC